MKEDWCGRQADEETAPTPLSHCGCRANNQNPTVVGLGDDGGPCQTLTRRSVTTATTMLLDNGWRRSYITSAPGDHPSTQGFLSFFLLPSLGHSFRTTLHFPCLPTSRHTHTYRHTVHPTHTHSTPNTLASHTHTRMHAHRTPESVLTTIPMNMNMRC